MSFNQTTIKVKVKVAENNQSLKSLKFELPNVVEFDMEGDRRDRIEDIKMRIQERLNQDFPDLA